MKYMTKIREVEAYRFIRGLHGWPKWLTEAHESGRLFCLGGSKNQWSLRNQSSADYVVNWNDWMVFDGEEIRVWTSEQFEDNFRKVKTGCLEDPDGKHNWSRACKNCGESLEGIYSNQKEFGVTGWHADMHRTNFNIPLVPEQINGEKSATWLRRVYVWLFELREEMCKP